MRVVDYFKQLEQVSGTNAKIAVLRQADSLCKCVLRYTYEPLWMYGIKQFECRPKGNLYYERTTDYAFLLLERLRNGVLSGNAAKQEVESYISQLDKPHGELFKKILLKDLRAGISVTTINKAIPGLISVFGTMLAKTYDGQMPASGLYMSLKLDGLRAIHKDGKLYTRNGHVIQGVGHITDALSRINWPFDGELMVPGEHFQTSSGALRSFADSPTAVYNIFDVPFTQDPFHIRLSQLENIKSHLPEPHIGFVKHILVKDKDKVAATFQKALDNGYEGLVLKTPNHIYQTKRSSDWLKLKNVLSKDLPIIGFFEGQGKYVGSLGGIIVDHNGTAVKVGGGFSDVLRDAIWANQSEYLGKTAETLYHEETPDGSLRHPRLKTIRVDK